MSLMKVIKKTWMHGMDLIVYFISLQLLPSFNSVTGRQCEYCIDSANIGACQTGTAEIREIHETNYLHAIFHSFFSFFFFWWWWWWWWCYAEDSNPLEWNFNQYIQLFVDKEMSSDLEPIYAGNWQINTVLIYIAFAYTVKECRKNIYFAFAHYLIYSIFITYHLHASRVTAPPAE